MYLMRQVGVKDDTYPLYKPGSCNLIDEQFTCITNGRPGVEFQKLKWKPKQCTLPRLNGGKLLEMIRGRRLAFVGDLLNRNMWESLFRWEAEYSFVFKDYNFTVEFFASPFLVQEWELTDKNETKKDTLLLKFMLHNRDALFFVRLRSKFGCLDKLLLEF
ncbi:unnamed protein product [Brassica oleracea]